MEQKREIEQKPEEKIKEREVKKKVETADALSTESIARQIGGLKAEIGVLLNQLSEKIESEVLKYRTVTEAISAKEDELEEIYEIQKSASSLAALIEAQSQRRLQFEEEMETK
jgi:hypothetical protein